MSARAARPAAGVSRSQFLRRTGAGAAGVGVAMAGMSSMSIAKQPNTPPVMTSAEWKLQTVLERAIIRGKLRVGVRNGETPFIKWTARKPNGDIDFNEPPDYNTFEPRLARGIAAALFGDPDAIDWVPIDGTTRFTHVLDDKTDINFRSCDYTSYRDADGGRGVDYSALYYVDSSQVWSKYAFDTELHEDFPEGAKIYVKKTAYGTIQDYMEDTYGLPYPDGDYNYEIVDPVDEDTDQYLEDSWNNEAYTKTCIYSDGSTLLDLELNVPRQYETRVTKAPFGVIMSPYDPKLKDFVNWCIYALFSAEEYSLYPDYYPYFDPMNLECCTFGKKMTMLNNQYSLFGIPNENWIWDLLEVVEADVPDLSVEGCRGYAALYELLKFDEREEINRSSYLGGGQYAPSIRDS